MQLTRLRPPFGVSGSDFPVQRIQRSTGAVALRFKAVSYPGL
jgi:hypothetical protein